jgi:hypothetical protein
MTQLQRLSFDRIETINEQLKKKLPNHFNDDLEYHYSGVELMEIDKLLYEQKNLIDALNEEDGKGYEEDLFLGT